MLAHHELDRDYASLTPEERHAAIVQAAVRRAHAERARVIGDMAKRLVRFAAFWRRGGKAQATPPNYARHA
jgi:hypothetical protein